MCQLALSRRLVHEIKGPWLRERGVGGGSRVKAATIEVQALFERDIRYLIPIYQRNYRWNEKEHWGPIWGNVRSIAEDILDFGNGPDIAGHFLGAIVCEQEESFGLDAHAVSVIDGQQRITTLQLMLAGALRVCRQRGFEARASLLEGLVQNRDVIVQERESHRYKVWPNVADREAYLGAMHGNTGDRKPEAAATFFAKVMDRWIEVGDPVDSSDDADNTPEERIEALVVALLRQLKIVKIDLEEGDNAQLIFETLNAAGLRLTDVDLIRNFLFQRADAAGVDVEALHGSYWIGFEDPVWQDKVAHGRHQRDRLSLFVNSWLSMTSLKEVQGSALFREFKDYTNKSRRSAQELAEELARYATVFLGFEEQVPDSPEWWFFRRLREMDLITVYPLLLWLFGREELPLARRRRATLAIESFLARRLLLRQGTRSYGALFVEALQSVGEGPVRMADERLIHALASKTADADRWPDDDELRSGILNSRIYGLKTSRLRMILEALDRETADDRRTETITLGNNLWIEHLLPIGWRAEPGWALPAGIDDPTKAALDRDHILHTLGNLTLTTDKLDIELQNHSWAAKRPEIERSSALALNRELLTRFRDEWNETTIGERANTLVDRAIEIWPSSDALMAIDVPGQ